MAQLVLGNLGAMAGQALLPQGMSMLGAQISGAALGSAIGSLAGAAIDARYLTPPIEGPRVKDFHLTESREGASVPVVYGRMRVGGQVIWAAQFRERREVHSGKGGPRVSDYSYSLSFAVALCEGEIARVSRCWANGEAFDLSAVTWRLYRGAEDQAPDPLIEAVEGAGEAPAYRGVAYIVFEDLPVDRFGARMPQLSFEVVRAAGDGAGRLERVVRAVNLIPGSGEFVLASDVVKRSFGPGREIAENLHGAEAVSDFEASVEQLVSELPNLSRVNLVVGWFGSDLRCGECLVRPGVEIADKTTKPWSWQVAGVGRGAAYVVSDTEGRPNYGGTPADRSVRQAVASLKARGLHVTLYPFLLMDIPAGNGLPDPYGGAEQAAFAWRGRVTCVADTGEAGDVGAQVAALFARYRAFVLHYAGLAQAEGADGLLIGSEMIGLTRVRDGAGGYPAVEALRTLAADVRGVVGDACEVSYAADWTEYGAHVVGDDLTFPLDALWADDAISFVGLDWYPPMADWRDGGGHLDAGFGDGRSAAYLRANVAGGEAFDWYYADADGRAAQARLAITDGAYGEPYVYRQKDIGGWWSHAHHPRVGGVRSVTATAWTPGMKPVRFVEMGCPAVDKGANQPNVFYDPKSAESALPHFSSGARDDLIQRRSIEAFHAHWGADANNPASGVYDGRMIPDDGVAVWAWDARPFPAFPGRDDVWSDHANWRLGHWLNGRVGLAMLPDVVGDIAARVDADVDVGGLNGVVTGYAFSGPVSARAALEPLMLVHGVDAVERDGAIAFAMRGATAVDLDDGLLVEEGGPPLAVTRGGMEGAGVRVRMRFVDVESDHAPGVVLSAGVGDDDVVGVEAAVALDCDQALARAGEIAGELTLQRDRARFALAAQGVVFDAGDVVRLGGDDWRIVEVADGGVIRFEAVRAGPGRGVVVSGAAPVAPVAPVGGVEPEVVIVDGPPLPGQENDLRPLAFVFAEPWVGPVVVRGGADSAQMVERGRVERPCAVGRLLGAFYPHVSGRWQDAELWVSMSTALASRADGAVLNGANVALVETAAGWEMVQFADAELMWAAPDGPDTYRLSRLLRGQQGSEPEMMAGAPVGARVVVLTGAEVRLDVADWEQGLALEWTAGGWAGSATHLGRAARMWSPAHLKVGWSGGDMVLTWTRRARIGGDSWGAGEPPHEVDEAYRVRVSGGGGVVRTWDVAGTGALYTSGYRVADFPIGGVALIGVAQLGHDGTAGAWTEITVSVPAP